MEEEGNQTKRKELLKAGLFSASLFLITYFAVLFITGLSQLYIAYDFDIPATFYLQGTIFHIEDNDQLWTRDALTSVLLAVPVSSFVVSMSALFAFIVRKQKSELVLLATLWLLLQSFNMTFGLISENLITQTGLARVARLQGLSQGAFIITVGLACYFMIQFGMFTGRLMLAHVPHTLRTHRYMTALVVFIIPWLAGNALVLALNGEPPGLKDMFVKAMMGIMLIPAFMVKLPPKEPTAKSPAYLMWLMVLTSMVVVWLSVVVLKRGISF
ncbi:MAG: hypothetical protein IPM52_07845 [Bacteroidetes bacterium]|nr:hypothetical protein [Bacteroidota bacterium]